MDLAAKNFFWNRYFYSK